jgi:hypothetical protein
VTTGGQLGVEAIDPKSDPDEEQIMLEESWPHISLVYEILLRVIISPYFSIKSLKNFINQKFLRSLF